MDEEEVEQVEETPQEAAPVEEAPAETEQDDPPAEGEPDFGAGLADEDGKLLGKYADVNQLARGYKNIESAFGKKSTEAAEYRKALESQGYTFDAGGKPIPPQAAAPAAAPAPQAAAAPPGNRVENGVEYDHLNMPVISEDLWEQAKEEDTENYLLLRAEHNAQRAIRQEQFNQQQAQRQSQALTARQAEAKEFAVKNYGLDEATFTQLDAEVAKTLAQAAPAARQNPDAYMLLMKAAVADRLPDILAQHRAEMAAVLAGNKEAIARGQRTVALEKGSLNAPAPAPKSGAAGKFSAAELQMAKNMGVSPEEMMKYADK